MNNYENRYTYINRILQGGNKKMAQPKKKMVKSKNRFKKINMEIRKQKFSSMPTLSRNDDATQSMPNMWLL